MQANSNSSKRKDRNGVPGDPAAYVRVIDRGNQAHTNNIFKILSYKNMCDLRKSGQMHGMNYSSRARWLAIG